MKAALLLSVITGGFIFLLFYSNHPQTTSDYDVYQYVQECKAELGIKRALPQLSCLDGTEVPIYVDQEEIQEDNWANLLSDTKKCDNPHWLGGDMGCWTYSHIQVHQLDDENVMVLNCRQKGNQLEKNWFRKTKANLGMNQLQRKTQYEKASDADKDELYYLYNTFNDIGIILRNTKTGKSCYITQYGKDVVGFLPPLDEPLPEKEAFLKRFNPAQARPPKNFPQALWYRDAVQGFRTPQETAEAGCVACHNAHGFKYSPYINSKQGLPDIYSMTQLPFLPVGKPFQDFYANNNILQITTEPIDGEQQLCTRCHNMTTSGTCGYLFDAATDYPNTTLSAWLTNSSRGRWMPPIHAEPAQIKKHVAALQCCCETPHAQGCKTRVFGPTAADLPKGFSAGEGWIKGNEPGLCKGIMESYQWGAEKF